MLQKTLQKISSDTTNLKIEKVSIVFPSVQTRGEVAICLAAYKIENVSQINMLPHFLAKYMFPKIFHLV